jgi:tRNA dimethylallyltransferase
MSKKIQKSKNSENKPKVVVILGPTASGKTGLAVKLANIHNGEVISADSRQVYRGMDVGSGKDLVEYGDVPYHLIDVVDPMDDFNLAKFQSLSFEAMKDICERKKLPIIAGGTGLYLQAVVDNYNLSMVSANQELRQELEAKSLEELLTIIDEAYPEIYKDLNQSERGNKRHLMRYIEIAERDDNFNLETRKKPSEYEFLIIGLSWPKEVLEERIYQRIVTRLENEDMVGEIKRLHEGGVIWKRLIGFGLEYQFVTLFVQEKIKYEEMIDQLLVASRQFAKRQMTWFKRWEKQGTEIHWVYNYGDVEKLVDNFLKK